VKERGWVKRRKTTALHYYLLNDTPLRARGAERKKERVKQLLDLEKRYREVAVREDDWKRET